VSSASKRACQAVQFDKLDTAKMHGRDTSNVSCRVETWRDEPSGTILYYAVKQLLTHWAILELSHQKLNQFYSLLNICSLFPISRYYRGYTAVYITVSLSVANTHAQAYIK